MAKNPYTEKHVHQFRGPSDSETFNKNSEDVYQDLVYLHNKSNELSSDLEEGFSATLKDLHGISREIEDLRIEMAAVKAAANSKIISYTGSEIEDTDRFNGTAYEVTPLDKLTLDSRFKQVTLPKTVGSSISRLKYLGTQGEVSIPPSLEMVVVPDAGSLDDGDPGTDVRTSSPYEAVIAEPGKVWERNVISTNPSGQTTMDLMFVLPTELTATPYANVIDMIPFPVYGIDVIGVYYSLDPSPVLTINGGGWVALNNDSKYLNNPDAVGKIPPGSWTGDEILEAAPLSFVFPSKRVTAMRITLRQQGPFDITSGGSPKYVYSYGLSYLDVRYDKFQDSGKIIYKLEPKAGDTISSIDSVTPYIYNVAQSGLPDVFSYRVIWETAPDSGTYTLTPVPLSEKVWLEVTLNKDSIDNLPALTGFKVKYS